jgi:hypothetical protein
MRLVIRNKSFSIALQNKELFYWFGLADKAVFILAKFNWHTHGRAKARAINQQSAILS